MRKKILLIAIMAALFICVFAINANAAPIEGYQQYEVELVDGSVITVYESTVWDKWQGRITMTDATYTEPPLDTDKTYPLLDWSKVVVADFTNGHRKQLNTTTGEYAVTYGTNGGYSMFLYATKFTKSNATNLKKIITGCATVALGGDTFGGFPALEEVICSEKLTEIGYNAFQNNKNLVKVDFSVCTNFKAIGQQAFIGCTGLETITLPNTMTSMGSSIFQGCTALKTIAWPTGITGIPSGTFNGCTNLVFEIPANITSIGGSAFSNCDSLVSVTIYDIVTEIGGNAFSNCDNLEEVIISENSQVSNKLVGIIMSCPKITSFRIPHLVTELGYDNFWDCTMLSEIIWPDNLTTISGGNNFANCTSLRTIEFPNSLTSIAASNLPSTIEEVSFGANIQSIGAGNLMSKNLKRVYFASTITQIGGRILGYSNPADSSQNITFIFTGTKEQAENLQSTYKAWVLANESGNTPNASKLYDAVLASASEYDITQEPSGYHFVYDYNPCDAFYGSEHNITAPTYRFVSYVDECYTAGNCTRCALEQKGEIYEPMVIFHGFSLKINASDVVVGYSLNEVSIQKYRDAGNTFDYGVVAYAPSGTECQPLTLNEGVITEADPNKTINANLTASGCASVDFVMKGLPSNAVSLAMCMYISDGSTIYYLCGVEELNVSQCESAYAVTIDALSGTVERKEA